MHHLASLERLHLHDLARQVARHVDDMRRLLDHLPARLLLHAPPGRARQPAPEVAEDETNRAPGEHLLRLDHVVIPAVLVGDQRDHAGLLHLLQDRPGHVAIDCHRLLNQHMEAALATRQFDLAVREGRSADEDRGQVLSLQHLREVTVGSPAKLLRGRAGTVEIDVAEADQLDAFDLREPIHVALGDPARANKAHPD